MGAIPSVRRPQKILILDDEPLIADSLKDILVWSGFEATAVYSPEEAMKVARFARPDLFLTDVMMPGMNGFQAAIAIQTMLPECHILLFSGHPATEDLLEQYRLEGYRFEVLAKPVDPQTLVLRLRTLM